MGSQQDLPLTAKEIVDKIKSKELDYNLGNTTLSSLMRVFGEDYLCHIDSFNELINYVGYEIKIVKKEDNNESMEG